MKSPDLMNTDFIKSPDLMNLNLVKNTDFVNLNKAHCHKVKVHIYQLSINIYLIGLRWTIAKVFLAIGVPHSIDTNDARDKNLIIVITN